MINSLLANYPLTTNDGAKRALDLTLSDDLLDILVLCSIQFWLYNSEQFQKYDNIHKFSLLLLSVFSVEFLRNFFNLHIRTKKQIKKHHQEQDGLYHHEIPNAPY